MLIDAVRRRPFLCRAVANGPVGPAMAGPIIGPVIFLYFFYSIFCQDLAGIIIEPVILFDILFETDKTQSP